MGSNTKANNSGLPHLAPKRLILAASIAALFCGFSAPAFSADSEALLDKLREKGVLSEEEYQQMRTDARAERRAQALKEANEEEKKVKKAESAASELTGRFRDGFSWESGDKENSISLSGRIQADYRRFSNDSGSVTSPSGASADTFDIRRAYLGVSGKLYNDWTFELTTDLAADTIEYAWINYKFSDLVQTRIGAFKMPFSYEELTSSRLIDFQERSLANALVPGKEQALSIYGSPTKWSSYAVAYSNGQGKEGDEVNATVDDKDLIARVAANFAEAFSIPNTVIHLGLGYTTGTVPMNTAATTTNNVPSGRTEGRGLTFFTGPGFVNGTDVGLTEYDRKRDGIEGILAWGPVKLQSEFIRANFSGTATGNVEFDRDITASYAALSWLITGEKYSDFYTPNGSRNLKPNRPFKKGADGWGAWELGVRFSKWDASDFTTTNPAGTGVITAASTNKADSIAVGLKWIPNTNTRIYLNYIETKFDTPITGVVEGGANVTTEDEKAITLRMGVFF